MYKIHLFLFIILLCLVSCRESQKPNVILFLVDDMGWTDASSLGSDFYETPNLDSLMERGVKFNNAYSSCPACSPTRASIMTGKHPARLNCTDWINGWKRPYAKLSVPDWTKYLSQEEYTMGEALKDEGYQTIHLGKWHLGDSSIYWPTHHGFDENIGGWSAGSPYRGNGYFSPYDNPRLADGEEGEYLTERLTTEAIRFLKQTKNRPFFMNFWLYNVHVPLQAEREKISKYEKKLIRTRPTRHTNPTYAAMIEHMDDALGKLIQELKKNDLYDNTIFIFSSDNGGFSSEGVTDNFPLRSGKGDMYEGGVKVPLVVTWPAKISGGRSSETLSTSHDLYPTIMGLLSEGAYEKPPQMDGVDLSKVILDQAQVDRNKIFWHYPHYHPSGAKPYSAIRMDNWKLIEIFEEGIELYNLEEDISESKNLAALHSEKVDELLLELKQWRQAVDAQMPSENPSYDPEKLDIWEFY